MKACLNCQIEITGKPSDIKRKKFCSRSCSSSYNNRKYPKKRGLNKTYNKKCECGTPIKSKRKFCDECWANRAKFEFLNVTKDELFEKCKNWQSASSSIRWHSRKVYERSDKKKCCDVCSYDRHFQVCHKRPVSSFTGTDNVRDCINHIDNLVALCPTHHWEQEHGFISYE